MIAVYLVSVLELHQTACATFCVHSLVIAAVTLVRYAQTVSISVDINLSTLT